ncbi:MAG: aminotransferase class III-fold pyridoxal phosphate-dependent enzyme [Planctomycetota bacterium]|nr:aminotransferase class III-fold pyridoxal phosphate-dependent enzyme [Planctomycetota bacterium]
MNSRELEDTYTLPTYSHLRFPLSIVRGAGSHVYDDQGNAYLDLYGGHAVCLLGHCHPRWVEEMRRQLGELVFYSNMVYHPLRGEAAELLVNNSYPSMTSVYFCGSGAEANETALKMARKATGRPRIVAMEGGFHGRTIGALSVTGFPKMRAAFPQNTDDATDFVPLGDLAAIEALDCRQIAAVILEPIQSVAGVRMAPPSYYGALRQLCRDRGIVLIFDEVQTGSGRTGEWYAGTHWGVEPDLVTTAKGVGGGFPVGVVIASEAMAETVQPGDQATTFGGGPLAVAAVASTYRILQEEGTVERVSRLSRQVVERLGRPGLPGIREVRGLGYLLGVECDLPAKEVQRRLLERQVLVGTSGEPHTFRLLPPLTVREEEWDRFFEALEESLSG